MHPLSAGMRGPSSDQIYGDLDDIGGVGSGVSCVLNSLQAEAEVALF